MTWRSIFNFKCYGLESVKNSLLLSHSFLTTTVKVLSYSEIKKERNHFMDVLLKIIQKESNITSRKKNHKTFIIGGLIYFKIPACRKIAWISKLMVNFYRIFIITRTICTKLNKKHIDVSVKRSAVNHTCFMKRNL